MFLLVLSALRKGSPTSVVEQISAQLSLLPISKGHHISAYDMCMCKLSKINKMKIEIYCKTTNKRIENDKR